ncbi:beta-1,3-galactosyltransferase 2-like [Pleurodeles waltl]
MICEIQWKAQFNLRFALCGFLCIFLISVLVHLNNVWSNTPGQFIPQPRSSGRSTTRHPLVPPYPYDYKFTINQPDKCQDGAPFLVMLVIVQGEDQVARDAIRRTWGNVSNVSGVSIVRLFVTAMSPHYNNSIQLALHEESDLFHDIIQQDFLDTYNNLTLKTLMGMEWVTKYCPKASYVLKIDSDMFLNVGYLVHNLLKPELPARKNYISGYYVPKFAVNREKGGKYYVPKEVYASDMYPPYVAGPGYVFSGDMAKKIYDVAQIVPLIHMEDAFVGICLEKLNVKITVSPPNLFNGHRINYDHCQFHALIMVHHYSPAELLQVWQDFTASRKCPSNKK